VYIVYHETFQETNRFFFTEAQAIVQIKKNVAADKDSACAWAYRIVQEGMPFNAILSSPDYGDVYRSILNEEGFNIRYTRSNESCDCYLDWIAKIIEQTKSKTEIVKKIDEISLGNADNIRDHMRICSVMYSIDLYLCLIIEDNLYNIEHLITRCSPFKHNLILLYDGVKYYSLTCNKLKSNVWGDILK
jgi:hypothetical protein